MSMNRIFESLTGLLLLALATSVLAEADAPDFLRLAEHDDGSPRALQVAVAEYRAPDGTRLDLVGAVHVGDAEYFEALDRSFDDYDVVLFELVGEPDALAAGTDRPPSMVGMLQGGMKDALGLAFQLEEIDYEREHFVHADMTSDEFGASMDERNESVLQMMFRAWMTGLATQTPERAAQSQVSLMKLLFADDRQLELKRLFARELVNGEDLIERMSGPDSTLIVQRNRKALEVLARERAAGHRRIALFYGAGHFPDFHRRLIGELDYEPGEIRWLDAWRLD